MDGVPADEPRRAGSLPLLAAPARRPLPLKPGGCQDTCVYVMLGWPYFGIAMGLFYVRAAVAAVVGRVAGRAKGD